MQNKQLQKENFEMTNDKITLHGRIDFISKKKPVVIFIPGINGKALTAKFDWLSEIFTRAGYNFVRFNFRGYENENNFEDSSLEEEIQDLKNLLGKLKNMGFNMQKYGIVAKSIGALKAISIQDSNLKCLGLFAPAISLDKNNNLSKTAKILYKNIGEYFEYKLNLNILNNLSASIIFYGDEDKVVSHKDTENLFKNLPDPKKIFCIPKENHSLEEVETKIFIKKKVTPFFQKYLKVENN